MPLNSLFIDFNAYFASVEQQLRPELRGRPVGVVPVVTETTCCIAASYEAKHFGVKTGTLVAEAKRLCPEIQLVHARHEEYIKYHHLLVETVESCVPVQQVCSIDEMVCELTGSQQRREVALDLTQRIKQTIAREAGSELRCSIGIAPNHYIAKTATDMQKPDGCVVIEDGDLPECLFPLALRDLCGIGAAMERRLHRRGIHTVEQLCAASKALLHNAWNGIEGERMYARLRGELVYSPPTQRSSVGHSHVLPPDLRNESAAYSVLHKLLQKAAVRLRAYEYLAGGMVVHVRYKNGLHWKEALAFDFTNDTIMLLKVLALIWAKRMQTKSMPIAVAVSLFRLQEVKGSTLSLFENEAAR